MIKLNKYEFKEVDKQLMVKKGISRRQHKSWKMKGRRVAEGNKGSLFATT